VEKEIKRLIRIFEENSGYIISLDHAIQAGTPLEYIFAMFETGRNYYPF